MEPATATRSGSSSNSNTGGTSGGASRTFQSLFGAGAHAGETPGTSDKEEPTVKPRPQGQEHEDDDVWDDDFPSDANMESAEEEEEGEHAKAAEARASMSEWADNDDDEDNWKDALQARVDQLELVVEKKPEPSPLLMRSLQTEPLSSEQAMPAAPNYAPPVDQRATLTLVPKTTLSRSISAPTDTDELKPASKLKAPQAVISPRANAGASGAKPKSNNTAGASGAKEPSSGGPGAVTGEQARKRSNSRDFLTRTALTKDHKRQTKSTPSTTSASNSVFVRAVVARGNSAGGRTTDTRITNETHVDKRVKGDDRAAILALSDAEAVRRHILNDVKKISVERIVSDAKRLQFLEDLHRRQPDSHPASARGGAAPSSPKKRSG